MTRFTILLALAFMTAPEMAAQTVPFGKNKIQYSDFDWRVLSGDHLDIYYYPEAEDLARMALVYGEESYAFLEQKLQHHPFRRVPIVVYASHAHFEQTNLTGGFIPEGVLGFTEFLKRRVALPFRGSYNQFKSTLRHELVHYFHISKLTETFALHGQIRGRGTPHWWNEGLAEYFSSPQDADDEMVNRDVVLAGRLPELRPFSYSVNFLAYPLGGELHHYLADRFGEERIVEMYETLWKYDNFDLAFEGVYGITLENLDAAWRYHLQQKYFPLYADRAPMDVAADQVPLGGAPNFKASIGRVPGKAYPEIFFFSPRTGYTDIYRANMEGPDRKARVALQGQRSGDLESFHAFESRMDISPNGVLAFATKFEERDALVLWDANSEERVGRYQWEDLVGVQSPSWNPDGTGVVFSGLSRSGFSDLYTIDFTTGERRQLTADHFEDEDPDWSPDGRTIVFSSDRSAYGPEGAANLYLYDLENSELRYLTHGHWKDVDPRWSGDGSRIAFASDRAGTSELYVTDAEGIGERVSNFSGGAFDPEWTLDDEELIYTGFYRGTFQLYRIPATSDPGVDDRIALELPEGHGRVIRLTAVESSSSPEQELDDVPNGSSPSGGVVSVARRLSPAVLAGTLASDSLPWEWRELGDTVAIDADPSESRPYSGANSIGLDFVAGDALIAPGLGSAQGIQFLGTDMLGNHLVFLGITAVQAEDFDNIFDAFSGQILYMNLNKRLNYGGGFFRYKGLFRDVSFNVYEESTYGAFFLASYPFSKYRRLELQIGVEHSDRIDREDFFKRDFRQDNRNLTRDAVLTRNVVSYVKDNTLWLRTGPIDGARYNVSVGLLSDLSRGRPESVIFSVDARRYLRTSLRSAIALRAFAYYSGGAIPGRAVLGGPHRLRGYPRLSLAGSRVWFVNSEWRFPLMHSLTMAMPFGDIRFPGVQGAFFADMGTSWLEDQDKPEGTWGSYGMAFRMSLGAPFVLRLDIGNRFRIGDLPPLFFQGGEDFEDGFVDFFIGFNY